MKDFDQEMGKKFGKQVSDLIKKSFEDLNTQIEAHIWKMLKNQSFSSEEDKQATFHLYLRTFYETYEIYLDLHSQPRAFKVRPRVTPLQQKSLKEILMGEED